MILQESTFSMIGVKNEYEDLRCNILGKTNCCRGLVVFLRQGMVAWISMLQTAVKQRTKEAQTPTSHGEELNKRSVMASELAVVLADAIIAAHGLN